MNTCACEPNADGGCAVPGRGKVSDDDIQWVRGAVATHPAKDATNFFDMMVMELLALRDVADAAAKFVNESHAYLPEMIEALRKAGR